MANSMSKLKQLMMVMVMGVGVFAVAPAMAQEQLPTGPVSPTELLPTGVGTTAGLGTQDIRLTIAKIIRVAMSLLGIVAVVIVLIGGFIWMTAGGNDDKVAEAKKWIYAGVIGLAIILSAYAIATFVIDRLVTATTDTTGTGTI